ncbi:hypothetical protein AADG42_13200 [Ammonicoccus fulvus]|uniref:Glycosyl hydrolase family 67 C-terminal domain-containing protein n=1 Tax=Ammonicoccus fulvus TaxID=3138240 RepID=A0ABZ3FQ85_9ACTN
MRRSALGTVVALAVGLVVGKLISGQLSSALAIRFEDKVVPQETPASADSRQVRPLAPIGELRVPAADALQPRWDLAERLLRDAVAARVDDTLPGVSITVVVEPLSGATDESFAVEVAEARVTVRGATALGATNGLFRIADRLAAGHDWSQLATDGVVTPALAERFVDTGAVGVQPDPDAYRAQTNYQHSSGALEDVVLPEAPYVDHAALERVRQEWRDYVDHVAAYGYNGVIINGFLEYVNFDRLGDGHQVYAADSPYRARHEVMKREVGGMWRYAHDMGLKVVFKSDMLALTGPLEAYLQRETGMDAAHPRLWEVYRAGFDEFFADFDWVDGFMIRIGEGGSIYNHQGWDYYSALEVTDAEGVRRMLDVLTGVAAEHDAMIYFRTWSVGVGDVGDMHTNPETYERLLGDFHRDNLVVSTKFVMGDFDSYLPLNPTLKVGEQRRLVEMQGRREFEAFSSIPNDLGPAHQTALRKLGSANEHLDGLWLWTQDGGPWRAGPMSLYLKTGAWRLYDLSVYAAAQLAWDPDADLEAVNGDWIRRTWTSDPAAVAAVGSVLESSRSAVLDGLYLRPYAEQQVFALGLEPPPMMWIFKWDIVSGDSAALSAVYVVSRGRVDEAIAEGERAVATAERMRAALAEVDRGAFFDPGEYDLLAQSLDYEVDVLRTLQTYRVLFLRYYEWLDTGTAESEQAWREALPAYHAAVAAHEARWTGNLDFPPFNFFAADIGMAHVERGDWVRWVSWGVMALALLGLLTVPGLRAGAFTPWRVRRAVGSAGLWHRLAVLGIPAAVAVGGQVAFSGALSPAYLLVSLGSLGLFAAATGGLLGVLRPGADPLSLWSAVGGAWLPGAALFAWAVAQRGPGGYWFRFWTDEPVREAYFTVAFALFVHWLGAVATTLVSAYGLKPRQGAGAVLVGLGTPVAFVGALLAGIGLERGLTTINDQMGILPLGLSRILGLTVHLGIPKALPGWLLGIGGGLAVGGALLGALVRRPSRASRTLD